MNIPKIEGQPAYNKVIEAAYDLFRANCISFDSKYWVLEIVDNVTIHINMSGNETKFWICSYVTSDITDNDCLITMHRSNSKFRVFGPDSVIEYLQMKVKENEWITNNEG
jgi:hypothetical protein